MKLLSVITPPSIYQFLFVLSVFWNILLCSESTPLFFGYSMGDLIVFVLKTAWARKNDLWVVPREKCLRTFESTPL